MERLDVRLISQFIFSLLGCCSWTPRLVTWKLLEDVRHYIKPNGPPSVDLTVQSRCCKKFRFLVYSSAFTINLDTELFSHLPYELYGGDHRTSCLAPFSTVCSDTVAQAIRLQIVEHIRSITPTNRKMCLPTLIVSFSLGQQYQTHTKLLFSLRVLRWLNAIPLFLFLLASIIMPSFTLESPVDRPHESSPQ